MTSCGRERRFDYTKLTHASPCSRQGLPPRYVTISDCELLPHSFHPFLARRRGGFVSVALSLGLPLVAVSNCHFPMLPGLSSPSLHRGRPANSLTCVLYHFWACWRSWSSSAIFTSPSATLFSSRGTWVNITFSNVATRSFIAPWIPHNSRFFTLNSPRI